MRSQHIGSLAKYVSELQYPSITRAKGYQYYKVDPPDGFCGPGSFLALLRAPRNKL